MSRLISAIRRVGTQALKFQFSLTVIGVRFSRPLKDWTDGVELKEAGINFVWSRGPRSASSKPLSAQEDQLEYGWEDQELVLMCTLYEDPKKKGSYQPKTSKIVVKLVPKSGGSPSVLGSIEFDISKYAGEDREEEDMLVLDKCRDKDTKLFVRFKSKWLKGIDGDEDAPSVIDKDRSDEELSAVKTAAVPDAPASPATPGMPESTTEVASSTSSVEESPPLASAAAPAAEESKSTEKHVVKSAVGSVLLMKPVASTGPTAEFMKLRRDYEALQNRLSSITTERDDYKTHLDKSEKVNKELTKKLAKRDEEVSSLPAFKSEKDAALHKVSKLEDQVKELTQKVKTLEKRGGHDVEALEKERADWMSKYERAVQSKFELEEKLNRALSEVEDKEEALKQVTVELEACNLALKRKQNDVEESQARVHNLLSELEEAKHACESYSNSLKKSEVCLKETLEKLAKAEKARDKTERDVEKLRQLVGEMEVKLVNVKVDLVNAVDRCNALELDNMKFIHELEQLRPRKKK